MMLPGFIYVVEPLPNLSSLPCYLYLSDAAPAVVIRGWGEMGREREVKRFVLCHGVHFI